MRWPWQKDKRNFHLGVGEFSSETFCIIPWIHLHSLPDGSVLPCCVSPYNDAFGNLKNKSFKELWNSQRQKELRVNMLSEVKSKSCKRCYEIESNGGTSMRKQFNADFFDYYNIVNGTRRDGSLSKMTMYYLDLRFSNICNLKCLGCSPTLSSSWYDDHAKLYNHVPSGNKIQKLESASENFWSELESILPHVERAYFAGGEPLLMPEHYKCLNVFLEKGKKNIHLSYNTNFMVMDSCGKNIFDYWNRFENVNLSISIDELGKRGEYFRFGTKWEKLVSNIRKVKENCPHVNLEVTCTVSLFNVTRLPEIHHFLYSNKFINEYGFFLNYLVDPHYLRSNNLSDSLKKVATKKIKTYIDEIQEKELDVNWSRLITALENQIDFMNQKTNAKSVEHLNKWINKIDVIRETSIERTFPEITKFLREFDQ